MNPMPELIPMLKEVLAETGFNEYMVVGATDAPMDAPAHPMRTL